MSNYKQTFGIRFGHKRSKAVKSEKGDPGIGFKLTHDNNYDMDNKRLTNVGEPIDENDARTKKICFITTHKYQNETKEYIEEKEQLINQIHIKYINDNFLHSKMSKLQGNLGMNNYRIKMFTILMSKVML